MMDDLFFRMGKRIFKNKKHQDNRIVNLKREEN